MPERVKILVAAVDPDLPVVRNVDPDGNAGWDLIATEAVHLPPARVRLPLKFLQKILDEDRESTVEGAYADFVVNAPTIKVPANIKIAIPQGLHGQVKGRSSNNVRSLNVIEGTIDSNYRGQVFVTMQNFTGEPVRVERGEKIAQLIIESHLIWEPEFVDAVDLGETVRGEAGFGSSGRF